MFNWLSDSLNQEIAALKEENAKILKAMKSIRFMVGVADYAGDKLDMDISDYKLQQKDIFLLTSPFFPKVDHPMRTRPRPPKES